MEDFSTGFLQNLVEVESEDLGYGAPNTFIDETGAEICPLTDVSC
jgi:hypothetical protein